MRRFGYILVYHAVSQIPPRHNIHCSEGVVEFPNKYTESDESIVSNLKKKMVDHFHEQAKGTMILTFIDVFRIHSMSNELDATMQSCINQLRY